VIEVSHLRPPILTSILSRTDQRIVMGKQTSIYLVITLERKAASFESVNAFRVIICDSIFNRDRAQHPVHRNKTLLRRSRLAS